jgi:hypothetical protein
MSKENDQLNQLSQTPSIFKAGLNSVSAATLHGSNVIPTKRKVVAESWADKLETIDLYDPRDVQVNRVTGGFNTAVQISASYSLRSYAEQIGEVNVIARKLVSRLESDLAKLQSQITDPWWTTLILNPQLTYGFGFDLTPVQLVFSDGNLATITFRGNISFMTEAIMIDPVPETGTRFPRNPLPGPLSQGVIFSQPGSTSSNVSTPMPMRLLQTTSYGSGLDVRPFDRGTAAGVFSDRVVLEMPPEFETPMRVIYPIGSIEVTLTAPYESTEHVPQRSVDVWMNMNEAKIVVTPEAGDAKLFYDTFLATKAHNLAAQIAPVAQIQLTPTISLAGRNPANTRIDEFTEFETRVFHVTERTRQALCIAFDVVPGCHGIIEDVRHFIGGQDYGVIHDEYVVERIVRHKWNEGGFDRSIGLANNVSLKVQRDGRDSTEDAMVFGRLLLNTLDVVALVPHADLRTDVLSLGGQAQAAPDRVVLIDGTVLTPDNADLGPVQDANWAVDIAASISMSWEPDPELRDFQAQAHRDGIRHLARPFSRFPTGFGFPDVQYTRTEAVQKRMFFLGQLPVVFI